MACKPVHQIKTELTRREDELGQELVSCDAYIYIYICKWRKGEKNSQSSVQAMPFLRMSASKTSHLCTMLHQQTAQSRWNTCVHLSSRNQHRAACSMTTSFAAMTPPYIDPPSISAPGSSNSNGQRGSQEVATGQCFEDKMRVAGQGLEATL
jgi:hypothetical protein